MPGSTRIADRQPSPFDQAGASIISTSVSEELEGSFLEYAYSVIHSRALPDARDGLKPVHRRILYGMSEAGLRPDHPYVKSARVVGDCMGRYHPHGDSAIYDAMVRLAQGFSLNAPMVDGHGNFGSPNDAAAAMRYTECRLSRLAMLMVGELDEGTVDFARNYDGSLPEPTVLPAAFPYLLVNGATGIAVGMSTNMIPHNLAEAIAAARLLIRKPKATLDELMEVIPGPDVPTGGTLIGLDQVRAAYETGRGTVRLRATASVEPLEGSRGRNAIVITALPYGVGTERIVEAVKDEIGKRRLQGISDVKDLSDRRSGTRLVIECKAGVNPQALLAELWRRTPLETSFGIQNLALVNGQPRTMGLKELLEVFLSHRYDVVARRSAHRLAKAEARLHVVDGLLIALARIDDVVRVIRAAKDTAAARAALIRKFALSDIQAGHILDMPLRRLVTIEAQALEGERAGLQRDISSLRRILDDPKALRQVVDRELAAIAADHGEPRRTILADGDLQEVLAADSTDVPVEIADEPCAVLLSATGLIARTAAASEESSAGRRRAGRGKHDAVIGSCPATTRGRVLLVTSQGRAFRVDALSIPALPDAPGAVSLKGAVQARELASLAPGERVVALAPDVPAGASSPGLALGTRSGTVKVCAPDWPARGTEFAVMPVKAGDEILSGAWLADGAEDLVFVTSDAQLLRFPSSAVRAQGRSAAGMAGIRLAPGASVVAFAAASENGDPMVVTHTGASAKVTPLAQYPRKGRGTGGVRAHRLLKGETAVLAAWIGPDPVASTSRGEPVDLPAPDARRDGSGATADRADALGSRAFR